ncbi:MAG: hypothetical protein K8S55_03185 [Phycisphaerae bacterium]|nr:hypothetical protein [Phycisphaerae bacterium]
MTKKPQPQQIKFDLSLGDAVWPAVEAVAAKPGVPAVAGKPSETLAITARLMPTRTDRTKDRDGWYLAEIDGPPLGAGLGASVEYRILPAAGETPEATMKATVADLLNNMLETGDDRFEGNLPNSQPSGLQPAASSLPPETHK